MKMVTRAALTLAAVGIMAVPAMADKLVVKDTGGNNKFVVTDTGKVGVGTATPTGGSLHVVATDVPVLNDVLGNNQTAGMGVDISTVAGNSPASGPIQAAGFSFLVKYNNGGAGINNNFNTFRMIARTDATVPDNLNGHFAGANFQAQHKGTGTAATVLGFIANAQAIGSGNITTAAAVRAATPVASSTGVITNAYGINIQSQKITGVTNAYGIYQEGVNDLNYFAGKIQAGGGSANKAICWKADGRTLGFCSNAPDSTGTCVCN